ncbi:hypothetical protein PFISCL1PPCAC_21455, partial [Pristionchus fissidentatus]
MTKTRCKYVIASGIVAEVVAIAATLYLRHKEGLPFIDESTQTACMSTFNNVAAVFMTFFVPIVWHFICEGNDVRTQSLDTLKTIVAYSLLLYATSLTTDFRILLQNKQPHADWRALETYLGGMSNVAMQLLAWFFFWFMYK